MIKDKKQIILVVSFFSLLGVAGYNLNKLDYAEYCKEPQAQCHLNNKASVTDLFKNLRKVIFEK